MQIVAGFPMPAVISNTNMIENESLHVRAYHIDGCTYAEPGQTVLCIVGGAVYTYHTIFMYEIRSAAGWERRQLFIDAEAKRPTCGWILKAVDADPNSVMPFFQKHGINITWAAASWIARD